MDATNDICCCIPAMKKNIQRNQFKHASCYISCTELGQWSKVYLTMTHRLVVLYIILDVAYSDNICIRVSYRGGEMGFPPPKNLRKF